MKIKEQNISMYISQKVNLFIIGVMSISLLCISCPSNNKKSSTEQLPSQVITNFTLFESATGLKLYRLNAEKAFIYEDVEKITVNKLYIIFYNEHGQVSSTLNALRGRVNTQTSDLFAQDSVIVQTSDSTILHTDSLIWNNRNRTITTDAWVKIESRQGLIEGQGLISDAELKRIEIKSSVTGKSKYEF